MGQVFVPFLGDFLSIALDWYKEENDVSVFVPFLGDFLSICIAFKLLLENAGRFSSPFLGTFFQYGDVMKRSTTRKSAFSSPFLGTFFQFSFNHDYICFIFHFFLCFRPLSWGLSFKACLRSPSPSALASAFAAGMRGSLHQALSFGDEMPIFPGRTGIGGDL